MTIIEPEKEKALVPRAATVEDVSDDDIPPAVPTPPPAVSADDSINVFDFLIAEDSPNPNKRKSGEPMALKKGAPSIFSDSTIDKDTSIVRTNGSEVDDGYEEHGFSYGTDPLEARPYDLPNDSFVSYEYRTPAAKSSKKQDRKDHSRSATHSRTNSGNNSDKKRKRGHVDELDVSAANSDRDVAMTDAPTTATPGLNHSGLTGGLNRLMSKDAFPRSPIPEEREHRKDRSRPSSRHEKGQEADPGSPMKRSRQSKNEPGLGLAIKGRAGKVMSLVGGASLTGALAALTNPGAANNQPSPVPSKDRQSARNRRSSSSDNGHTRHKERKKHKAHQSNGSSTARYEHADHEPIRRRGSNESSERHRRHSKAIEYHRHYEDSGSETDSRARNGDRSQLIVFGEEEQNMQRTKTFFAHVPRTMESGRGYSVNKVLKRWHQERSHNSDGSKAKEEKELWRTLRLRKNDRDEIVVFFAP